MSPEQALALCRERHETVRAIRGGLADHDADAIFSWLAEHSSTGAST
jgi:hypothetical protein